MKKVKLIMQKFLEENYIKYIKMPKNIIIFNIYQYFDKKIMPENHDNDASEQDFLSNAK